MREYLVSIPIAGSITYTVEADSEEEAIDQAWNTDTCDGVLEWEALNHVVDGNVCYAPCNEVTVEEV